RTVSTRCTEANTLEWLTQMQPTVTKLMANAANVGQRSASAAVNEPDTSGTRRSSTSRVMATANTASLNSSTLLCRPATSRALMTASGCGWFSSTARSRLSAVGCGSVLAHDHLDELIEIPLPVL